MENAQEVAKVRERLAICRARLLEIAPFFGYIALRFQMQIHRAVPTAGVNARGEMSFNPDFVATLTDDELLGLLVHECLHPAFNFFGRLGSRNKRRWNCAHDYAINLMIADFGKGSYRTIKLPEGGLLDEKYRDWSAEQIYDDLQENGGGGDGDLPWEDLIWSDGPLSEAEQREREQYWKGVVVEATIYHEGLKGKGSLPGSVQKYVDSILAPRVDWPMVLANWIGENGRKCDYSYHRPSRRSEAAGAILATQRKFGCADVTVLWDTSGSMKGREREIMGEVIGMCDEMNMSLRVIVCDAAIHSDQSNVSTVEDISLSGGGGSDFCPAFDRLDAEASETVVIAFTDGVITVPAALPERLKGMVWVLQEGENPPASYGETIRIGKDNCVRIGPSVTL